MKRTALLLALLVVPVVLAPAQTNRNPRTAEERVRPQWVRDLRRWEIIAFGSFPFSMFFTTFTVDMFRWSNNSWDNRYAPWPMKAAGAIAMTSNEMEMTLMIAAGLSVAIALTDFFIVQARRRRARLREEALPVGTAIITHTPWGEEPPGEPGVDSEEADIPDSASPAAP